MPDRTVRARVMIFEPLVVDWEEFKVAIAGGTAIKYLEGRQSPEGEEGFIYGLAVSDEHGTVVYTEGQPVPECVRV